MFIEINETGRYCLNNEKDANDNWKYKEVVLGKVLVNTEHIRNVSIAGFEWENTKEYKIKENSQRYIINFDKDRHIYTDKEGYEKIKNLVLNKENCI